MRRPASDRSLITSVIVGAAILLGAAAVFDAVRSSNRQVAASTTTDAGESGPTAPAPPAVTRVDASQRQRVSRTVGDVRFSFLVRTVGWGAFGRISINKSISGPQDAEAIIFWATFPEGDTADPCFQVLSPDAASSAGSLADAVAKAPGTDLVRGPLDVTLDGRAAKHVVITVREQVGCKPGFFYEWQDERVGALWPKTRVGDTVRVWVVEVGGTRLFIEAETSRGADAQLEDEVEQIVQSIRFD